MRTGSERPDLPDQYRRDRGAPVTQTRRRYHFAGETFRPDLRCQIPQSQPRIRREGHREN